MLSHIPLSLDSSIFARRCVECRNSLGPTMTKKIKWRSSSELIWFIKYYGFPCADAAMGCDLKHDDVEACGTRTSDHSNEQELQEHWLQDRSAWRRKSRTALELPAFGIACYKLRGPFWASAGPMDKHNLCLLATSAESWLKQLRVQHPDFDFFASREGFQVCRWERKRERPKPWRPQVMYRRWDTPVDSNSIEQPLDLYWY